MTSRKPTFLHHTRSGLLVVCMLVAAGLTACTRNDDDGVAQALRAVADNGRPAPPPISAPGSPTAQHAPMDLATQSDHSQARGIGPSAMAAAVSTERKLLRLPTRDTTVVEVRVGAHSGNAQ